MYPWYPRVADHDSTLLRIPPPQFIDSETISWISPCPGAKNPFHPLEFPDISPWSAWGSTPGASQWHVHYIDTSVPLGNIARAKLTMKLHLGFEWHIHILTTVRILIKSFSAFIQLKMTCMHRVYDNQKVIWWLEDMTFIFSWWKQYYFANLLCLKNLVFTTK